MKKSSTVLLSVFFLTSVTACMQNKEWITGTPDSTPAHDTIVDAIPYRFFRGEWFEVHSNNMIKVPKPFIYDNDNTLASRRVVRRGGFGCIALRGYTAHS